MILIESHANSQFHGVIPNKLSKMPNLTSGDLCFAIFSSRFPIEIRDGRLSRDNVGMAVLIPPIQEICGTGTILKSHETPNPDISGQFEMFLYPVRPRPGQKIVGLSCPVLCPSLIVVNDFCIPSIACPNRGFFFEIL